MKCGWELDRGLDSGNSRAPTRRANPAEQNRGPNLLEERIEQAALTVSSRTKPCRIKGLDWVLTRPGFGERGSRPVPQPFDAWAWD